MTSLTTITLDVDDPAAAQEFYDGAFGPGLPLRLRASAAPTSGFRAFTVSLIVDRPADVDRLAAAADAAGATTLKPPTKSMWGYGAVLQAPDGTIWKAATPNKKKDGPATGEIEHVVVLLGVADIGDSKRFYTERGFEVGRSVPRTYVEFEAPEGAVKLGLYKRRALAKDAGVDPEGSGAHRVAFGTDADAFTDPDGFVWEPSPVREADRRIAASA